MLLLRTFLSAAVVLVLGAVAGCDGGGYRRTGGHWTFDDIAVTPEDPASFKPLDGPFARDARRGYYRGVGIADSDGASFAVVSKNEARDRARVYYCDTYRKAQEYWSIQHLRIERVHGADAATYVALGGGYSRDVRRVYAQGEPMRVADPASFQPLDGDYARDAQRGYYARTEIPGSHGPSFETLDPRDTAYARDRTRAYHGSRVTPGPDAPDPAPRKSVKTLQGADPSSLKVLGRDYASDGHGVWYRGIVVAGADAASFTADTSFAGAADARDRSGEWDRGRRLATGK